MWLIKLFPILHHFSYCSSVCYKELQGVQNKDHLFYFKKHAFKKQTQNAKKKIKKNESRIARL